jgi:hypothetical protein
MPWLFQVIAGFASANIVEWVIHKYVLHGLGKDKSSIWRFHWSGHHRAARKHDMYDESYLTGPFHESRRSETLGMLVIMLTQAPFFWVAPGYTIATWVYSLVYLWAHRKAHLDTVWGKKWMPWHVDHHLGQNQDQNWGVVAPWFDWAMGTRKRRA